MPSIAMQSHTGSGKTLAYLIPIFCDILRGRSDGEDGSRSKEARERCSSDDCGPSEELAMQIVRTIETVLGPHGKDITQQLIEAQMRSGKRKV